MPVTEAYMDPGDWRLSCRIDTRHLAARIAPYGQLVVVPQWVGDPAGFTDTELLEAARYAGPVLDRQWDNGILTLVGAGMDWWLGDRSTGIGPRPRSSTAEFVAAGPTEILSVLVPDTLDLGVVVGDGAIWHTADYRDRLAKTSIATFCAAEDLHYRIHPTGVIDFDWSEYSGVVFVEWPTVIVSATNPGSDALWTGATPVDIRGRSTVRDHMNGVLVGVEGNAVFVSGNVTSGGYGPHGWANRHGLISDDGTDETFALGAGVLAAHGPAYDYSIRLAEHELVDPAGGYAPVLPGDRVYVWDPASGLTTDWGSGVPSWEREPLWFRGEAIAPVPVRVVESEWPLVDGMGVYYRPPIRPQDITSDDWVDLTRYVEWEATPADGGTLLRIDQSNQTYGSPPT